MKASAEVAIYNAVMCGVNLSRGEFDGNAGWSASAVSLRFRNRVWAAGTKYRLGHHERTHCGAGRGGGERPHNGICRRGERRRMEVGERRDDVQAGLRSRRCAIDWRGGD